MRRARVIIAAWIAPVLAVALSGCGREQPTTPPARQAVAGPRLTVALADTADWQTVPAEVTSQDQAQVLARASGVLSGLSVRAGDSVRRGQVIGRISDSLGGGNAAGAAAMAQAELAQAELKRVRFLYQNGVYAQARLDQAEALARIAHAQVSGIRATLAVVAPATGRVLRADVPMGAPVAPGVVVATITSGPVLLRLDLPEALAARVMPGAQVRVADLPMPGRVTRVYPAVQAGQVQADVAIAGLDARLIGRRMVAQVAAGNTRAIIVPRAFVTTRYGLDYVTIVARDGSGAQVPVQTAPAPVADGRVQILSGVNPGDVLAAAAP
ncbi:efflux RND transporter periplasmic adaptor subunit [Novosphingobium sp. FSY-8]|uniref:Efflux RND transporter periplasmic adaptor subunit n=1 Tax=Novosphingobium ovatum TaxID=1908523 RepID=A0ABW9X983_9SPHN|nr:efflux RND transporter periplasmic adaptor subunit [Novosphingobium ovatum]NBC35072.1 efflux RND transporter periplasmic adaptor subunit [Novosphingobium ovatum]